MVLPDGTEMPGDGSLLEVVPNHCLVFTACCCPTGTPPSGPGLGFTAIIPLTTEGTGIRYTVRARHRTANQAKARLPRRPRRGCRVTRRNGPKLLTILCP